MADSPQSIRVRIAPSPTGTLHVGTARTALFNELFARHHGGTFIIRIEDTDQERSKPEHEATILEGLKWLGITWDEGPDVGGEYGPYRQSERKAQHRAALEQLIAEDKAYIDEANNGVVRLRVSPQVVTFTDLIRGEVTVQSDSWGGDFIIARGLDDPLFHLAVVVDDAAQAITHVIRGEDHLTNTARHIILQQALGYAQPTYAHLPLLLDKDRRKLSKRAGEVSLLAYQAAGYLAPALLNYLALLGWSPKDDREFFTHAELVEAFDIAHVHKGGAIFSVEKLQAVNKHYLRQLSLPELRAYAEPALAARGITITTPAEQTYWEHALSLEQPRLTIWADIEQEGIMDYFAPTWAAPTTPEFVKLLVWKKSDAATTKDLLAKLSAHLETLKQDAFNAEQLEAAVMPWIDEHKLGRGDVLWPMRVALSGRANSPGPFEIAGALGKLVTMQRLQAALNSL